MGSAGPVGPTPVTMPPWEPGEAQTVLTTTNMGADSTHDGLSPWVAFLICGVTLAIFLLMMVLLMFRSRFRKGKFVPPTQRDEEQTLLDEPPGERPGKTKVTVSQPKLRQASRKHKNSKGSLSEEETPMLSEPQSCSTENQPERIEMTNFSAMDLEDIPMIDSDAADDDLYPTLTKPVRKTDQHPGGTPPAPTATQTPISPLPSPISTSTPIAPPAAVPLRLRNSPQDEVQGGRAWTESQVLEIMEDAEEHGLEFPSHPNADGIDNNAASTEDNTMQQQTLPQQTRVNEHKDFEQQLAERSRAFDDSDADDGTEPIEVTAEVYSPKAQNRDGDLDPTYCNASTLPLTCHTGNGHGEDTSDDEEYIACPIQRENTNSQNQNAGASGNLTYCNDSYKNSAANGYVSDNNNQGAPSILLDDDEIVEDPIVEKVANNYHEQTMGSSSGLTAQHGVKSKRQSWAKQKTK